MSNIDFVIKGAIAGLTLSFLIGPVFFAIVQAGVERGFRAGLALCSGIWLSDIIIIALAYLGLSYILMIVQWEGFAPWLGTVGGLVLMGFGIGSYMSRLPLPDDSLHIRQRAPYLRLSAKGFVVNVFNPFTIVFWLGLMSTIIAQSAKTGYQAVIFFITLLVVMMTFDVLKIILSKTIRNWISPENVLRLRKGIGIGLFIFGVVLLVRVWLMNE